MEVRRYIRPPPSGRGRSCSECMAASVECDRLSLLCCCNSHKKKKKRFFQHRWWNSICFHRYVSPSLPAVTLSASLSLAHVHPNAAFGVMIARSFFFFLVNQQRANFTLGAHVDTMIDGRPLAFAQQINKVWLSLADAADNSGGGTSSCRLQETKASSRQNINKVNQLVGLLFFFLSAVYFRSTFEVFNGSHSQYGRRDTSYFYQSQFCESLFKGRECVLAWVTAGRCF